MPSLVNKETFWVVVANEARVIAYAKDLENDRLEELFSLENTVAREKMADLISDRGGRSFDSHGEGRHTIAGEKSDPKQHASAAFAKMIAQRITAATNDGKCRGFALVAAPRFLGVLRDALSVAGNATPVASIDKDVVDQEAAVIDKMLAEHRKG